MVLKYVVTETEWPTLWFGVANVIANALVSLRYVCPLEHRIYVDMLTILVVLWFSGFLRIWRMTIPITCSYRPMYT